MGQKPAVMLLYQGLAVKLASANLTGAWLINADLSGTDLTGVVWNNTTCPDGTVTGTRC